jgi:ABC-type amino acid transport system permease subunit
MGLRINTEKLQSAGGDEIPIDGYVDRLRKYIPTEAVTFWLTVSGMIQSAGEAIPRVGLLWLFFVICLVFTFGWTRQRTTRPQKHTAWTQIAVSIGSFVVWVFATGGPLATSLPFYQPLYGSLLLVTYTAAVAFIVPPEK